MKAMGTREKSERPSIFLCYTSAFIVVTSKKRTESNIDREKWHAQDPEAKTSGVLEEDFSYGGRMMFDMECARDGEVN